MPGYWPNGNSTRLGTGRDGRYRRVEPIGGGLMVGVVAIWLDWTRFVRVELAEEK